MQVKGRPQWAGMCVGGEEAVQAALAPSSAAP